MPIDLVGKTHRTVIIEGVHWIDHDDLGKFFQTKCGGVEAIESINERLWIIFNQAISVENAKKFEGMTFKMPQNKVIVRCADEKIKFGKSILSRYSTSATIAPRSEVVSLSTAPAMPFGNVAGLLGPAQGSSVAAPSVKDAANQDAQAKKAFLSALTNKDNMKLMLGGPTGWTGGNQNSSTTSHDDSKTSSTATQVRSFLEDAEAEMKADIQNNVTIKSSTGNLLPTIAGQVISPENISSSGGAIVGPSTIPTNMRLADVDDFMNEHLRRQCDALITLSTNILEKELQADIAKLRKKLVKKKEKRDREEA